MYFTDIYGYYLDLTSDGHSSETPNTDIIKHGILTKQPTSLFINTIVYPASHKIRSKQIDIYNITIIDPS